MILQPLDNFPYCKFVGDIRECGYTDHWLTGSKKRIRFSKVINNEAEHVVYDIGYSDEYKAKADELRGEAHARLNQ